MIHILGEANQAQATIDLRLLLDYRMRIVYKMWILSGSKWSIFDEG